MKEQIEIPFYYNTNQSDRETLIKEISKAMSLEDRVFEVFTLNPKQGFIWSDLVDKLGVELSQYGSIKRCLTNLMNRGKLYKSTNVKLSVFDKKAHFYFLV